MLACSNCSKTFRNAAALNFHQRKEHGGGKSALRNSAEANKEVTSQPSRKKGQSGMVRFAKFPGAKDYTKGPFKTYQITVRIDENTESESSSSLSFDIHHKVTVAGGQSENDNYEMEVEIMEVHVDETIQKKRSRETTKHEILNSPEKRSKIPYSSPVVTSPEMPVLSPQQTLRIPESPIKGRDRPGPKRSKMEEKVQLKNQRSQPLTLTPTKTITITDSDETSSTVSSSSSSGCSEPLRPVRSKSREVEKGDKNKITKDGADNKSTTSGNSLTLLDKNNDKHSREKSKDAPSVHRPIAEGTSSSVKSGFICQLCNQTGFKNQNQFRNHLEIHEGKRPFICPLCHLGYETEIKLLEHVSIRHSQAAKFTCPDCNLDYKTQRGLEGHRIKCSSK